MTTSHIIVSKTVLIFILILGCIGPFGNCTLSNANTNKVDTIIVVDQEWLPLVATPVISKLDKIPVLMTTFTPITEQKVQQIKQIASDNSLILTTKIDEEVKRLPGTVIELPVDPTQAAIFVAHKFWKQSRRVVIASIDDPKAILHGTTLAAHMQIPFIPVNVHQPIANKLTAALAKLKCQQLWLIACSEARLTKYAHTLPQRKIIIDEQFIYKFVLRKIGRDNVRNIILTRIEEPIAEAVESAWIAPYLSFMRQAPILFCNSVDGRKAQDLVYNFIKTWNLRPRSLTILADYSVIGVVLITGEMELPEDVEVEPCAAPQNKQAVALGVGRIPFNSFKDAANLVTRTIVRERLVKHMQPKILMIANPKTSFGELPLAETIARATASEFKNLHMDIEEFYGADPRDQSMLNAVKNAHLLIYEGHIYDQYIFAPRDNSDGSMFEQPDSEPQSEDDEDSEQDEGGENSGHRLYSGFYIDFGPSDQTSDAELEDHSDSEVTEHDSDSEAESEIDESDYETNEPESDQESNIEESDTTQSPIHNVTLKAMPLVIFQSCSSLEKEPGLVIFNGGGVGFIGTVTSVHSASGSSFIKAFCDEMLYRNATVGEALRDARNFYLCLAKLKNKRGHKETAKCNRVALSFRLWGDPETTLFARPLSKPNWIPVQAKFTRKNNIRIVTPSNRLAKTATDKYFTRVFAGSHLAGIVKSLKKNKSKRRIMPLYFFRLPIPQNFVIDKYKELVRVGDKGCRSVFLPDSYNRYAYVLYFPQDKPQQGEKKQYLLKFFNFRCTFAHSLYSD